MSEYDDLLARVRAGEKPIDAAPTPDQTDYKALLDEVKTGNHAVAQANLNTASFGNPQNAATRAKLTEQLKTTLGEDWAPSAIDPAEAQRRLKVAENDHVLRNNPVLARQYMDTGFAELTFDDVPKLGVVEGAVNSLKSLVGNIGASVYGIGSAGYGLARAASENLTSTVSPPSLWLAQQQQYAEHWKKEGENLGGDLKNMPVMGPVYQGVQSAWQNMMLMPMAFLTGSAGAAVVPMSLISAGQAYGQARDQYNASPLKSLGFAAAQGTAEGATEMIPMGRFVKDVNVGAPIWKMMRNQLVTENVTEQAATAWQDFNEWAMLNPDKPFQSYIDARPGAALDTLIATTTATLLQTGAVQGAMRSQIRQNRAAQAERAGQALDYLNTSIGETELSKRDRGALQQFLQQAALDENGQEQTVRINALAFENTLMQAGLDPAEVLAVLPTAAEQWAVAKEVGGDLEMPLSEIAAQTFGSDISNALLPHIAVGEEAMSLAEAQQFQQGQAEEFRKQAEVVMAEKARDDVFVQSAQEVEQIITQQLATANRFTPDVNRAYATQMRDFYVTTAARMGITPGELYAQFPLNIVAEGQGALNQNVEQTNTPEFKAWFGDSKVVDAEGRPLVVYHGTVGDFSSFSVAKMGETTGAQSAKAAFFFTDHANTAADYSGVGAGRELRALLAASDKAERKAQRTGNASDWDAHAAAVDAYEAQATHDLGMAQDTGLNSGANVMPAFVSLKTPLIHDFAGEEYREESYADLIEKAKAAGNDGVVFKNTIDPGNPLDKTVMTVYGVFNPTQIKSAIGNNGNFDPNDANILRQAAQNNSVVANALPEREAKSIAEARVAAAEFLGKLLHNEKTGLDATVSKSTLGKMTSSKAVLKSTSGADHALAVANADKLFRLADLDHSHEDGAGEPTIAKIHRYVAPMINAEGNVLAVKLTVKETTGKNEPNPLYSIETIDVEKPALRASDGSEIERGIGVQDVATSTTGGLNENIAQTVREVKAALRQDNRGGFSPESLTLILGKKADLSTFLHESSHFYLKVMGDLAARPNAPVQIRQDFEKTLAWFGIQGSPDVSATDLWNAMTLEEQRPYHEKWAESFEAYLFSGRAPSIELQTVFSRFKQWMLRVYQSAKEFAAGHPEAEMNPEISAIFDRLLATDEQIKLAEQARSMMPLFGNEQQSGMTPGEWAAYQELGQEPTEEAKAELGARGVRDITWLRRLHARLVKKYNAEAAALREQEAIEARREVMTQPIYQVWQFLTGKAEKAKKPVTPEGVDEGRDSLFVAIAKLGGINTDQMRSEWGVDKAEKSPQPAFGKRVWGSTGKTLDEMRLALEDYGYLERSDATNPDWNPREFEERFNAELSGDLQYSSNADYDYLINGVEGQKVDPAGYGKLGLEQLRSMGLPEELVGHLKALRMTAAVGSHPDAVAEKFGFSSGDELVRRIAAANTPKEAIEALVDQRMLENHGELASPQAIALAVDAAIHNEARARLVATELRFLTKVQTPVRVLMAAAKDFAEQILGRKKIRDLTSAPFISAASRAAANAQKAMADGKHDIAAAELRNQLLNTTAANRAIGAKAEVEKALKYLKKFLHGNSRNSIDVEYLEQIDTLLERFDLKAVSNKEIDRRTALAKWVAAQEDAGLEPDIPDYLLAEANRTHYKNLTLDEFRGLVDTVRQIEHLGRLKNRLLTTRDKKAFDEVVRILKASIDENNIKDRKANNVERDTWVSRAGSIWKGAMAAHRKMASMVREIDGFKDGGPMWEYVLRSMNDAGNREATMREQATIKLNDLFRPVLAQGRMGGKGVYIPAIDRSLNRTERIAVALNIGNDGNYQRLLSGYQWSPTQVTAILSTLTREDLAFVQNVWDFFESYRPLIGAKEKRVAGKEPDWIPAVPRTVTLANGEQVHLRGGYYPVKYDPRQSVKAGQHQDSEDAKAMMRAAYTAATTRRSFTKTRAEEVKGRPLLLSADGLFQGANEVIHDLAWHEWLIDANKLMRAVGQDINDIYGAEWVTQFKRALEDVARGEQPAAHTGEKILTHLRTGSTIVGLGWNLTTALLQPLGITQSMVRIGPAWVARGMKTWLADPIHAMQYISDKSEFMRVRAKTMMREINEIQNQVAGKSKARTMTEATFFILIQKVQLVADIPTWYGAYEKAMSESTDEARAVALADQAVIDSQGGGQTKDLSMVQRGSPAWKLFTNFYSFFNVALNLGVERTRQTNFKKPAEVARLAGDYLLLYSVPAVLGALLKDALKGGDDDEEKLISKLIAEQISFLLGLFVGLREIAPAVQKAAGVSEFNIGYGGPAGLRFFQELDKLGQQVGQGEWDDALRKSLINTTGMLFHYPAGAINRAVDGTVALVEGRTSNPLAPLVGPPPKN